MSEEKPNNSIQKKAAEIEKTAAEIEKQAAEPKSDKGNGEKQISALSVQNSPGKQPLKLMLQEHTRLPGQRPVEASHLRVVETFSGGHRPIVSSGMDITGTLSISGRRPITSSHLKVSENYFVMGNRPVASNEIDDSGALMGYLD